MRGVGVGVAAAADGVDQRLFQRRGVHQLPQGVVESQQHPAHVMAVVGGRRAGRGLHQVAHGAIHRPGFGPGHDLLVQRSGSGPVAMAWATAAAYRAFASPQTGLGWVRAASSRAQPATWRGSRTGAEDAQRADPHQRAVGLALLAGWPPRAWARV